MQTENSVALENGGIIKEILKIGTGTDAPLSNDRITIHYVGKLIDETQFDNSRDREKPFEFVLDKDNVIPAWNIGIKTMKHGELARFTCHPDYAYGEQGHDKLIPPKSTVIFEIELLDFRGEDLSKEKDETILKRVLKRGQFALTPKSGSIVEITLRAIENERKFDERRVKFTLGEGLLENLPESLERAISHMRKGEYSQITLKSKALSGIEHRLTSKSATVQYFVHLADTTKGFNKWVMSNEEKFDYSEQLKRRGAELIKKSYFQVAKLKYETILDFLQNDTFFDENEQHRANHFVLISHSNIALCNLKLFRYAECIRCCDKVLEMDENNEKSLFRRGQSQFSLFGYEEAIIDFQRVLQLNPKNAAATKLIEMCQENLKNYEKDEKKLYSDMFRKLSLKN